MGETLRQHEGGRRIPKKCCSFGIVCTFCHRFSHCKAIPTLTGHQRHYSGGLEMASTWAVPSLSGMLLWQLSLLFQSHCQQHFHEKTLVRPTASIPPKLLREPTVGGQPRRHAACLPPCGPSARPAPWLHSAFKLQFLWKFCITELKLKKSCTIWK